MISTPMLGLLLAPDDRAAVPFDPATLSLTGWWRASYAGSPWAGTASAGGSGTRNLAEATNFPDVGAALNGFTTADFEQSVSDFLDSTGGNTLDTFVNANAGSAWALIRAESVRADQADAFNESVILGDGCNFFALVMSTSGVRAALYDGAWKYTPYQALATATWGLAQIRWNGATLESRVNGGAWQTVAAGSIANLTFPFQLARNANVVNAGFFDGLMADVGIADSRFSDAQFDQVRAYITARYGASV